MSLNFSGEHRGDPSKLHCLPPPSSAMVARASDLLLRRDDCFEFAQTQARRLRRRREGALEQGRGAVHSHPLLCRRLPRVIRRVSGGARSAEPPRTTRAAMDREMPPKALLKVRDSRPGGLSLFALVPSSALATQLFLYRGQRRRRRRSRSFSSLGRQRQRPQSGGGRQARRRRRTFPSAPYNLCQPLHVPARQLSSTLSLSASSFSLAMCSATVPSEARRLSSGGSLAGGGCGGGGGAAGAAPSAGGGGHAFVGVWMTSLKGAPRERPPPHMCPDAPPPLILLLLVHHLLLLPPTPGAPAPQPPTARNSSWPARGGHPPLRASTYTRAGKAVTYRAVLKDLGGSKQRSVLGCCSSASPRLSALQES